MKLRLNYLSLKMVVVCFSALNISKGAELQARQVVLNEVMSSNSRTIADEDGDYPDWIELYNAGGEPVALGGYGLSDDLGNPFRWVFPDTTLAPGGYMLVWASNKERAVPGGPLHTNFAIASSGEPVLLTRSDGELADLLTAREIPTDWSAGRYPDGTGEWVYFDDPTPGSANITEPVQGLLEPLVFSHEPGFYREVFDLEITHPEEGVTIYYTLDGSEPTRESAVYEGPIRIRDRTPEPNTISMIPTNRAEGGRAFRAPLNPVRKGTVVRSLAVKYGFRDTSDTRSYFIFNNEADNHALPVISLTTDTGNLFDNRIGIYVPGVNYRNNRLDTGNYYQRGPEWERRAGIEFFDELGIRKVSQDVGIRIHGGLTRFFPQKSLRVYARREYGENRMEYPLFEDVRYTGYKRFILRNSGNDFGLTMMRDAVAQKMVEHFNLDTQAYRPSVVYINGEYWGIHNIRERYDKYYLERVYDIDPDHIDLITGNRTVVEGDLFNYGNLLQFIENHDLSDEVFYQLLDEKIDIDNFIDYNTAQVYLVNIDWPQNNIDFWRSRTSFDINAPRGKDGRWRWLLYDMDYSLGYIAPETGFITDESFDMVQWLMNDINPVNGEEWPGRLFRKLINNQEFKHRFINRLADHLNTSFREERLKSVIEEYQLGISAEMTRHSSRWGTPGSVELWEYHVGTMMKFVEKRADYVRTHLMNHFNLNAEHLLRVNPGDSEMGTVYLNSLPMRTETPGFVMQDHWWEGIYFTGVNVQLRAEPNPGYQFKYWLLNGDTEVSADILIDPEAIQIIRAVFTPYLTDDVNPFSTEESDYLLEEWNEDVRAGSFPDHMAFVYMNEEDPGLDAEIAGVTFGAYNLTSRTRINGLGEDGFSFINTSNPDGNPGYPGTRLGGAVLVLDTRGSEKIHVGWRAGTIERNSRIYRLRLQYRTDGSQPFRDVPGPGGSPVGYQASEVDGHTHYMGPVALPDDAANRERVELLWRYYDSGEQIDPESNRRSELSVSEIYVSSQGIVPLESPHRLEEGSYHFTNWPADADSSSYPASMAFVFMNERDPGLQAEPLGYVTGRYDHETRTRVTGLGEGGFSFVNTSGLQGNPGLPGRRLGGAILALNLERQGSATVEWSAATLQPGSRIYGLRLQYRTDPEEPFRDISNEFGEAVEYIRHPEAGHRQTIGPVLLPPETDGKPYVELFWRYYDTGVRVTEESGERSELAITEIRVSSLPLLSGEPGTPQRFRLYQNYPNPFYPNSTLRYDLPEDQQVRIDLFTIDGRHVGVLEEKFARKGRHSVPLSLPHLASGVYIYRFLSEEFHETGKLSIIK
ncbi:MAG: T9SS C-terminal target domain-containing protein [Balneolaceae bacterium]|nr:MAG: T9SS C-terminal target domain-containing protein [Balneolaceae bacterium]